MKLSDLIGKKESLEYLCKHYPRGGVSYEHIDISVFSNNLSMEGNVL
jgi:hypothetical protein